LSDCELAQVPDAVFHLMRQTNLSKCDLSFNSMTKIPAKLATNFVTLTGNFLKSFSIFCWIIDPEESHFLEIAITQVQTERTKLRSLEIFGTEFIKRIWFDIMGNDNFHL